ncbi:hypothetical protein Tco_0579354 [Tanacetum coccineum]
MSDPIGGLVFLGGDVVDLTSDEDPTDEDGDTGMGDSTGVSVSLGGEISSGGKKSQESNIGGSDNTKDRGEIVSEAKRYLVKSSEKSGEVFPVARRTFLARRRKAVIVKLEEEQQGGDQATFKLLGCFLGDVIEVLEVLGCLKVG